MAHLSHGASAPGAGARPLPTHVRDTLAEPPGRQLMPFDQALIAVADVGAGLQGLCELLHAANSQAIEPTGLLHLLRPLAERLNAASCDLNDMRVVDLADVAPRREQ